MAKIPGKLALHGTVLGAGLLPLGVLLFGAFTDRLDANPIEHITHSTGKWAIRLLLLSLAVRPAQRWLGWSWALPLRRTLGLLAFTYACLHFLTWLVLDQFFDWEAILEDVAERRYITMGFAAFLCLVPLAITSTRSWIRRLGRRLTSLPRPVSAAGIRLQRLGYAAAVSAVIHYVWQVKADWFPPAIHAAILAALLAARFRFRTRPVSIAQSPGGS